MLAPAIECPASSDTGAYRLTWRGGEGLEFKIVETDAAGTLRVVYQGGDTATTISGRLEGPHAYQAFVVEDGRDGAGSAPCVVEVQPPSMTLALALFSVGLLVCVATTLVIVVGHRAHRRGALG